MKRQVLLVDDDPNFRALVVPLLGAVGLGVLEASTGREAMALFTLHRPALVVMDGLLPDTDGVTWIAALRAAGHGVPVVFASAFWRDRKARDRLTGDLAVSLVLQKPILPSTFVERLLALLGPETPEGPAAVPEPDEEFAGLKATYAKTLPAKLEELVEAVAAARAGGPLEDAIMKAHRVRGTAGSYGFQRVGDAAARVESALLAVRDGDESRWEEARAGATDATRAVAAPSAPAPATVTVLGRMLVVGTDAAALALVEPIARMQMLGVTVVPGAAEALVEARARPPDLALFDADLPGNQAFRLIGELRELTACAGTPVAILSSDTSFARRVAAAHAGASLFIEKPLDEGAVSAALPQLLAQRPVRPRILLVDDDPDFREKTAAMLARAGMDVRSTDDPRDLLETLEHLRPDLLLLDVELPDVSGFDVCRMLRTSAVWRSLPVLFMTARTSVESRVAAFQAGGDDYLQKPVVEEELLARLVVRLERMRLMKERAEKDGLTGVATRRSFVEQFSVRLQEAKRHGRPLTLAILDLDHFKAINDDRGHLVGDRVLATLGKLLGARFRAADVRGRWGGEEFALAFPDESLETATGVVSRLLEELRAMPFEGEDGATFTVSFSAGMSTFPGDGPTFQALARTADRRMYAAKLAGRGRVVSTG